MVLIFYNVFLLFTIAVEYCETDVQLITFKKWSITKLLVLILLLIGNLCNLKCVEMKKIIKKCMTMYQWWI